MLQNMESLTKKIYKLMKTKHNGYAFIYDDFTNIGKYNAVRQSFSRLEKENKIKKIIAGMYYVPNYIPLIKEYEAPAVEEILKALSRKFG